MEKKESLSLPLSREVELFDPRSFHGGYQSVHCADIPISPHRSSRANEIARVIRAPGCRYRIPRVPWISFGKDDERRRLTSLRRVAGESNHLNIKYTRRDDISRFPYGDSVVIYAISQTNCIYPRLHAPENNLI